MTCNAEQYSLAVRRPMQVFDPAIDLRRGASSTAAGIEQEELKIAGLLAVREESNVSTVRGVLRKTISVRPERQYTNLRRRKLDAADPCHGRAFEAVEEAAGEDGILSVGRRMHLCSVVNLPGARLPQRNAK